MNLRNLVLTTCMFCSLTIFASNSNNPSTDYPPTDKTETSVFSKLFMSDYDNSMLFIDFQVVNIKFTKLTIFQNDDIVIEEDISDLSTSTIYEVNFDQLNKSHTYVLKLETVDGFTINKEFVIN